MEKSNSVSASAARPLKKKKTKIAIKENAQSLAISTMELEDIFLAGTEGCRVYLENIHIGLSRISENVDILAQLWIKLAMEDESCPTISEEERARRHSIIQAIAILIWSAQDGATKYSFLRAQLPRARFIPDDLLTQHIDIRLSKHGASGRPQLIGECPCEFMGKNLSSWKDDVLSCAKNFDPALDGRSSSDFTFQISQVSGSLLELTSDESLLQTIRLDHIRRQTTSSKNTVSIRVVLVDRSKGYSVSQSEGNHARRRHGGNSARGAKQKSWESIGNGGDRFNSAFGIPKRKRAQTCESIEGSADELDSESNYDSSNSNNTTGTGRAKTRRLKDSSSFASRSCVYVCDSDDDESVSSHASPSLKLKKSGNGNVPPALTDSQWSSVYEGADPKQASARKDPALDAKIIEHAKRLTQLYAVQQSREGEAFRSRFGSSFDTMNSGKQTLVKLWASSIIRGQADGSSKDLYHRRYAPSPIQNAMRKELAKQKGTTDSESSEISRAGGAPSPLAVPAPQAVTIINQIPHMIAAQAVAGSAAAQDPIAESTRVKDHLVKLGQIGLVASPRTADNAVLISQALFRSPVKTCTAMDVSLCLNFDGAELCDHVCKIRKLDGFLQRSDMGAASKN